MITFCYFILIFLVFMTFFFNGSGGLLNTQPGVYGVQTVGSAQWDVWGGPAGVASQSGLVCPGQRQACRSLRLGPACAPRTHELSGARKPARQWGRGDFLFLLAP